MTIEQFHRGRWIRVLVVPDESFGRGYLAGVAHIRPRPPIRLVRSDPGTPTVVLEEIHGLSADLEIVEGAP